MTNGSRCPSSLSRQTTASSGSGVVVVVARLTSETHEENAHSPAVRSRRTFVTRRAINQRAPRALVTRPRIASTVPATRSSGAVRGCALILLVVCRSLCCSRRRLLSLKTLVDTCLVLGRLRNRLHDDADEKKRRRRVSADRSVKRGARASQTPERALSFRPATAVGHHKRLLHSCTARPSAPFNETVT